ncbi:hypothetical protein STXM2123_5279 [Streptomyces sp. F-3]|nr:hypothetical protein STXM2123_5279 [Streptomyces sp. F-3]
MVPWAGRRPPKPGAAEEGGRRPRLRPGWAEDAAEAGDTLS